MVREQKASDLQSHATSSRLSTRSRFQKNQISILSCQERATAPLAEQGGLKPREALCLFHPQLWTVEGPDKRLRAQIRRETMRQRRRPDAPTLCVPRDQAEARVMPDRLLADQRATARADRR